MLLAKDIMRREVFVVHPLESVKHAIQLLIEHGISGAPVVDDVTGALVGFVSEYDLILAVHAIGSGLDVQKAMKTNVMIAREDTPVTELADLMLTHRIRRVPVVNQENRPIGIVSRREILAALYGDA